MDAQQKQEFEGLAPALSYGVWALALSDKAKNMRVWDAIEPGDIAAFYTSKRFTHFAPIRFKWKSPTIERIAGWGSPTSGAFSLAFLLDSATTCDLSAADYCALVGYVKVPVHSDFHTTEQSIELLEALQNGISVPGSDDVLEKDMAPEGRAMYRIQCFRERSDGNRLKVLQERSAVCEVCGFDFQAQYGHAFRKTAHVHHKSPLALGERRALSTNEFAVLCASCHMAAHMGPGRKLKPWSIEELRELIARPWNS